MTSMYDVLRASKGLPVDDIFAQLWGRKLSSDYTIEVYTGTLPAVITGTKAGHLHRYKIYGNTEQASETPTPENPIVPSECGDLETTGVHAGQYKLPLTSAGQNVDIYLGVEPLRKIGDYADYIDYGTGKIVRQVAKKVFAGTETFTASSRYSGSFYAPWSSPSLGGKPNSPFLCTHGEYSNISQYSYGKITSDQACNLYLGQSGWTAADFKSYLYAQYTAGTPVTIWYVLSTPVEEDPPVPFPQIPTSTNSTTISWAGSGLAPSQVELTYEKE